MKKALPVFLAVLVVLLMAVSSPASPAPLILSHTFTPSTDRGAAVTVSVHLENIGSSPLSNITVSLEPRPPFVKTSPFSAGDLASGAKRDLVLKLPTLARSTALDTRRLGVLLFTVRYIDAKGETVHSPTLSRLIPDKSLKTVGGVTLPRAALSAASQQAGPGQYLFQFGVKYHFLDPGAIAVDASGNVYVADTDNGLIRKYDSNGNELLSWTGADAGQSYTPRGIAVDASGNVYVTDTINDRVQKFDSNGTLLTTWGSTGSGNGQFQNPTGIAVDSSGNVYVADTANARIQKFDSSGGLLAIWDNLGTDDGRPFRPYGLAIGRNGELYATDSLNATVHKFDSSGNLLLAWAISGDASNSAYGIATDRTGKVYVTTNGAIQVYDSNGKLLTSWGSYGTGNGQFQYPGGVAVDGNGIVYVADTYNQRIQKFDNSGNFLAVWASVGSENGLFNSPEGIALDRFSNVYVADTYNHRIQKFAPNGNFLVAWGTEGSGNGQFEYPVGVAVDQSGYVYVADTGNERVQKFDSNGNFISAIVNTWSGSGPIGIAVDRDANIYIADIDNQMLVKLSNSGAVLWRTHGCYPDYPPNDVGFFPRGIAIDAAGNIYVTDVATFGVQKLDRNGKCIAPWERYYEDPVGIAVDRSSHVYVLDNGGPQVNVLDTSGNFLGQWGSYGTLNGQFIWPWGIAVDMAGSRVYVADSGNNRIEVFTGYGTTGFALFAPATAAAGTPFTFAVTALDAAGETSSGYTGTVHFTSSDPRATLPANAALTNGTGTFTATLRTPGSQTITVTDTENRTVTGTANPIAVTGTLQVPDLTIAKCHIGSFMKGHRAQYRITVKNSGTAPTAGRVRVSDSLPWGLTASAIGGRGWTCTTRPLSCTTTKPLAAGASYPPINLTVTVKPNAPPSVTNTATVSGGGEVNVSNDTARDTARVKGRHH